MTLFLEIIHPNNVVDGFWREVERPSSLEDAMDHLASPSFEWSLGTCVRVHDGKNLVYSGIYNHHECVDVGPDSACLRRHPWWQYGDRTLMEGVGLFDLWTTCQNATLMLNSIAPVISQQTMARAAIACLRTHPDFENSNQDIKRLAIQIEKWSRGESTISQLQSATDYARSSGGWISSVIAPITWIGRKDYNHILANTPKKLSTIDDQNRQLKMAFAIRESIPFYEIAVGYVTTD